MSDEETQPEAVEAVVGDDDELDIESNSSRDGPAATDRDDDGVPYIMRGLVPGNRPPLLANNGLYRCFVMVQLLFQGTYVAYRLVTFWASAVSIAFFTFEWYFMLWNALIAVMRWTCHNTKLTAPNLRDLSPWLPEDKYLTVTVFVPTYDESIEILSKTLRAVINLDYPVDKLRLYVLDDGGREELKEWVENELKMIAGPEWEGRITYAAREKDPDKPHYAKAGNMNFALNELNVQGDLIMVLDADMVPKSTFLQRTIPFYFEYDKETDTLVEDKGLVVVQTPQVYTNVPGNDFLDVNQSVWYYSILPGLDSYNSAPFCGSNALLRRQALLDLPNGGFSYSSLTEDLASSLEGFLHNNWRTRYLNERLCFGMAPVNMSETLAQRTRWLVGAMQMLLGYPVFDPKIDVLFIQRFTFFMIGGYSFLVPVYLGMVGIAVALVFDPNPLTLIATPYFGNQYVGFALAGGAYTTLYLNMFTTPGRNHIKHKWRMTTSFVTYMPSAIIAIFAGAFKLPYAFEATNKNEYDEDWKGAIDPLNAFHLSFFTLMLIALIYEIYQIVLIPSKLVIDLLPILFVLFTLAMLMDVVICLFWPLRIQRRDPNFPPLKPTDSTIDFLQEQYGSTIKVDATSDKGYMSEASVFLDAGKEPEISPIFNWARRIPPWWPYRRDLLKNSGHYFAPQTE